MATNRNNVRHGATPSRRALLLGVGTTVAVGAGGALPAIAAPAVPAAPVAPAAPSGSSPELKLGIPLGGGPQVLIPVTLEQRQYRIDALAALKKLRRGMWATNPYFDGERLQAYLRKRGISSAAAYADLVQWSTAIEIYAIQRALECTGRGKLSHSRPDGESLFAVRPGGHQLSAESLAWNYPSITDLLDWGGWGYGELEPLNEAKGHSNSKNGHLHQMLDPTYITYGIARVGVCDAALSARSSSEDQRGAGYTGDYTLRTAVPAATLSDYTYKGPQQIVVGKTGTATVTHRSGALLQGTWSSSSTSVATVDAKGVITARRAGTATIALKAAGKTFSGTVTVTPAQRFIDVAPGSMYFDEIEWLAAQGISTGWPDRTYRPLIPIARDAMAAFLYRSMGSPSYTPPRTATFRDVSRSSMYYKEIEWLAAQGITTGWPDGTFRPLLPIARDAMAAFVYRAAGKPRFTAPTSASFRDVGRRTMYFKEIEWMRSAGITTGWPDRTFRPLDPVNRDAMAAFIHRAHPLLRR